MSLSLALLRAAVPAPSSLPRAGSQVPASRRAPAGVGLGYNGARVPGEPVPHRLVSPRRLLPAACRAGGVLATLLVCGGAAQAQELELEITDPAADEGQIRSSLGGIVDDQLRLGDQSDFLEQMTDATLLAAKGMGVDYASSPQRFVLGVSVGSALSGSGFGFGYGGGLLPSGGFAFQMAITGGINLGFLTQTDGFARRVMIYGHGMGLSGSREPFESSMGAYGGNVQVALVKPMDDGVAGWGGLQLTTGVSHARYELRLTQAAPIETDTAAWEASGSYVVSARGTSLPLELSTNMRLAVLTVFGGGGLDVDLAAGADSEIALEGPISTTVEGQRREVGTARVSASDGTTFVGVAPRGFAGLQINILPVKLYGQLNIGGFRGFGGHAGVRVAM